MGSMCAISSIEVVARVEIVVLVVVVVVARVHVLLVVDLHVIRSMTLLKVMWTVMPVNVPTLCFLKCIDSFLPPILSR